jgi:hypothetical protein
MFHLEDYTKTCSKIEQNIQLIELSNDEAKTISGGVLIPPHRHRRRSGPTLPLPRGGGIQPVAETSTLATIIASLAI